MESTTPFPWLIAKSILYFKKFNFLWFIYESPSVFFLFQKQNRENCLFCFSKQQAKIMLLYKKVETHYLIKHNLLDSPYRYRLLHIGSGRPIFSNLRTKANSSGNAYDTLFHTRIAYRTHIVTRIERTIPPPHT